MRRLLLCWALLLPVIGLAQPSSSTFTLGILRRDALIVPIATYDGARWKNVWPGPSENAEVPANLRSVPPGWWGPPGPREIWQAWTSGPPQLVTVRQPDWVPAFCQKQIGLRTNYQPRVRPPKPETNPFPKDGLAVSPPHPVEPIEVLALDSSEAGDVIEAIHATFVTQENTALMPLREAHISNPRLYPEAPDERELRRMPPITIDALYAYGAAHRTYFVEAVREYRKKGACTAMAFGTGWLNRDSGKFTVQTGQISITSCDRRETSYMLPLGVLRLPTGTFWIAQTSSWYRETYSIRDISGGKKATDLRPALITTGGSCLGN